MRAMTLEASQPPAQLSGHGPPERHAGLPRELAVRGGAHGRDTQPKAVPVQRPAPVQQDVRREQQPPPGSRRPSSAQGNSADRPERPLAVPAESLHQRERPHRGDKRGRADHRPPAEGVPSTGGAGNAMGGPALVVQLAKGDGGQQQGPPEMAGRGPSSHRPERRPRIARGDQPKRPVSADHAHPHGSGAEGAIADHQRLRPERRDREALPKSGLENGEMTRDRPPRPARGDRGPRAPRRESGILSLSRFCVCKS